VGLRGNTAGGATAAGAAGTRPGVGVNARPGGAGVNAQAGAGNRFNNFGGVSQTPFFSDPGVRQQLNLNDNQFNTLNRAYQNAYSRFNQGVSGLNNNLSDQQRMQQMQQLEGQFNSDFGRSVNSTITDSRMRNRFGQLNRQFSGLNAFNDPAIRQQLNLTSAQQQQLRRLSGEFRRQMVDWRRNQNGNNSVNNAALQQQWAQLRSQYQDQLNSILTPQQQQIWSTQVGQAYNFPYTMYFPQNSTQGTQAVIGDTTNSGSPSGTADNQAGVALKTNSGVNRNTTRGNNATGTGGNDGTNSNANSDASSAGAANSGSDVGTGTGSSNTANGSTNPGSGSPSGSGTTGDGNLGNSTLR
jgi:hypothetical protein